MVLNPFTFQTLVPLGQLLNAVDDNTTQLLEEQLTLITSQSIAYKKKVEHLSELLNDSEATVVRLTDQATVTYTRYFHKSTYRMGVDIEIRN